MWCHEHFELEQGPDIVTFAKKMFTGGIYHNKEHRPKQAARIMNTWVGDPHKVILLKEVKIIILSWCRILTRCVHGFSFSYFLDVKRHSRKSSFGLESSQRRSDVEWIEEFGKSISGNDSSGKRNWNVLRRRLLNYWIEVKIVQKLSFFDATTFDLILTLKIIFI